MPTGKRHAHVVGHGPGVITPDGCPVELWASLPPGDIASTLAPALPPASAILDLGAGAGRLTHVLTAAGHRVTAVDESAAMLSHVRDSETICSTIEDLRLDRRFDAVLLASHLVNVPDEAQRGRLLTTCRRHVRDDGVVLIQRFTPESAQVRSTHVDLGAGITQDRVIRTADDSGSALVSVVATSRMNSHQWEQAYTTAPLGDGKLDFDLRKAQLRIDRWLSDDGTWVVSKADLPAISSADRPTAHWPSKPRMAPQQDGHSPFRGPTAV